MSAVQANWHLDLLGLGEGDPMQADIADIAPPIDLSKPVPELREELRYLMRKEARYATNGVTCDLKWSVTGADGVENGRNPCHGCPQFTDDFENQPKAVLCAVGRRQNVVMDSIYALVSAPKLLDAELVSAHEREVAEIEELLQAVA